jgi:aspartyl-tRNA(Asn)/glutamyl-tRNA(Gln) amidotransferase subunit A
LTAWEPADPLSCPAFAGADAMTTLKLPLSGLRLAWTPQLGLGLSIDGDVRATLEAAVARLRAAGWTIDDADPAWPAQAREYPLLDLQQAALAQLFGDAWRRTPERFDPDIGRQIELGLAVSGLRIAELLRLRERQHASLTEFFSRHDALLCPVAPVEAWPIGLAAPAQIGGLPAGPRGHAAFTPLFNYTGVPAISIPCGSGRRGLPVGLQIVGPRFADARVLQLAWHAEQVLGRAPPSPMMQR